MRSLVIEIVRKHKKVWIPFALLVVGWIAWDVYLVVHDHDWDTVLVGVAGMGLGLVLGVIGTILGRLNLL